MSQSTESIIRKHVHDIRNHLNGMEMDAIFLSDLFPESDSQANQISQRWSRELDRIEIGLRFLSVRFVEPEIGSFSAVDLFNLWKSRSSKFIPDSSVKWDCQAESEFIDVDGKMVADLLSILLASAVEKSEQAVLASAIPTDGGVTFEIRIPQVSSFGDPVEFLEPFTKNGGRLESKTVDDEFILGCVFETGE